MFRKKPPRQEALFIPGKLSDFIPDDHILKRVDRVLDLSWLDEEVRGLYKEDVGRPCIEPERAVRLMLAGFFHGIVKDRKLIREAHVNIAFRWFCGYDLDQALPDHSSLTRIRQRWGAEMFRKIFTKIVEQCAEAGLVGGEMTHCDASLIRADVSWESLVATHVDKTLSENQDQEDVEGQQAEGSNGLRKTKGKTKKVSKTDPEASMATSNKKVRLEPTYKQHTAVDDKAGVVVDVEVTTGEVNEGVVLLEQINRVEETTGKRPKSVTCDRGYGSGGNYEALETLKITAIIPPPKERPKGGMPLCRFRYDEKHDVVRCPANNLLARRNKNEHGWFYKAKPRDCKNCRFRDVCVPKTGRARSVLLVDGYTALLRARRSKRQGWSDETVEAYKRHRYQVEGVHGEQKTEHGLARATRRGTWNVRIQSFLSATAVNLKRLAKASEESDDSYFVALCRLYRRFISRLLAGLREMTAACRFLGIHWTLA